MPDDLDIGQLVRELENTFISDIPGPPGQNPRFDYLCELKEKIRFLGQIALDVHQKAVPVDEEGLREYTERYFRTDTEHRISPEYELFYDRDRKTPYSLSIEDIMAAIKIVNIDRFKEGLPHNAGDILKYLLSQETIFREQELKPFVTEEEVKEAEYQLREFQLRKKVKISASIGYDPTNSPEMRLEALTNLSSRGRRTFWEWLGDKGSSFENVLSTLRSIAEVDPAPQVRDLAVTMLRSYRGGGASTKYA